METVGFRTRDGFLFTFPKNVAVKGSTVVADMVVAQDTFAECMDVQKVADDEASSSTDVTHLAPKQPIIIDVDANAIAVKCAAWCLIDKSTPQTYKKEGIAGELISKRLKPSDVHEARQLAFTMDF